MSTTAPKLPGLELLDELGRGARSAVYRGRLDGRMVAVKLPRSESEIRGLDFRREAALQAQVSCRHLPEIYEVGERDGSPFLIMELVEGETLDKHLRQGPLTAQSVLQLAEELATTLAAIHTTGLVHRDLKPANILITPEGKARLIDLGLATRTHLSQGDSPTGTFRYSAPEQTGMLDRPLDGRADLYALGVVLFECLAGRLPFEAEDPAELIRQHAVATPPPLIQLVPDAPEHLLSVIGRLLHKDPDDRFPSAGDLLRCLGGESDGKPAIKVSKKSRVAGRLSEMADLKELWQESRQSQGRLCLLCGEPGSGKSFLASEFAASTGALVLRGHSDPSRRPFGLLQSLFQRAQTRAFLEQAATTLGAKIDDFFPALGESTASADRDHRHSLQAMTDFLVKLAQHFPAVIILEDLDWIDPSSLEVLKRFTERLEETRCLLLATSRSDRLDISPAPDRVLRLKPLCGGETEKLLEYTLGGPVESRLVEQVILASDGSPMACLEITNAALDSGLFLPHWGRWRMESEGLSKLDLPSKVMTTVLSRLEHLSPGQRKVIETAAVIGSRFRGDLLAKVSEATNIYPILAEGVRLKLLEKVKSAEPYRFVHEAVRESLLSGLPDSQRRQIHRQIASALEAEEVFARAEHLWLACAGSLCPDACEASLAAGLLAMAQQAYPESYDFFSRSQQCRSELAATDPEFEENFGEAAYRTARFEEALSRLHTALTLYQDRVRRAAVYQKLVLVHMVEVDTEKAWPMVLGGLGELQRELCSGKASRLAFLLLNAGRLVGVFQQSPVAEGPGFSGEEQSEEFTVALRLYLLAVQICILDARVLELLEVLIRGLKAASRLGPSPALANFYGIQAVVLSIVGQCRAADRLIAHCLDMSHQLQDPAIAAQAELHKALSFRMRGKDSEAAVLHQDCLRNRGAWLSTFDYLLGYLDLTHNLHFRGFLGRAGQWAEVGAQRVQTEHFPILVTCTLSAVFAGVGRQSEARRQAQICRKMFESSRSPIRRSAYLVSSLHAALESGEMGSEVERWIQEFGDLGFGPRLAPFHSRTFYIVQAHLRYRQCLVGEQRLKEFSHSLKQLRQCPPIPLFKTHLRVLEAGYLHFQKRYKKAEAALREAEQLAHRHDNPWVRLEVLRLRAFWLREQGLESASSKEASLAVFLARDLAWVNQVFNLEREFQVDHHGASDSRGPASQSALVVRLQRNLEALMQVSLDSVRVLDGAQLCRQVLAELVKILGAERAFFFLHENDHLRFEVGLDHQGETLPPPRDHASTVVDQVAKSRQSVLLSGTEEGRLMGSESVVTHDLRSILAAPLTIRDRLLGVVYLDSRLARGVFSQDDLQLLRALANQIAVTLETARAARLEIEVRSEREGRHLAEALGKMAGSMLTQLNPQAVLEKFLESLASVMDYQSATIEVLQEGELQVGVSVGEPRNPNRPRVSTPLRTFQGEYGVVTLERDSGFDSLERELLHTFAGYAGLGLENARLFADVERLATTDELTGLSNRRHFFARAEQEFRRADRFGHELSVMMFDIDFFKKFNDNYGHATGDLVLSTAAQRCKSCFRDIDILGRYGGEEFAVVLVGTGLESGLLTAERLRRSLADMPMDTSHGPLGVTISIGVATRQAQESLSEVLERADQALYRAKEAGRNRVERG